jgi:hypothetical protein
MAIDSSSALTAAQKTTLDPSGWVIATATALIWECSGIAAGWCADSFGSEGVGQLLLLVFLEVYIACYGLHGVSTPILPPKTEPWQRIATNDDGLISRITTSTATTTDSLSAVNGNMSWATKTRRKSGTN